MFSTFDAIIKYIKEHNLKKTAAIAAAHDADALSSAIAARRMGIMDFVLVGDKGKINKILEDLGETPANWEIIDEEDETAAANMVARMVSSKKVDMPMKGILHTSIFLKALFNKEVALVGEKALISQAVIFENPIEKRLMLITDCVVNINPDYESKQKIIKNAVALCHKLKIEQPKVAIIAAVETVNPTMPECVDAAMLSKAWERGMFPDCIVDGPLALDLALSKDAARIKGVTSPVAGNADILVMPNLVAGNIFDKSVRCLAGFGTAGAMLGAKVPFISTSRSDTVQNKLNTMAVSILQI